MVDVDEFCNESGIIAKPIAAVSTPPPPPSPPWQQEHQ